MVNNQIVAHGIIEYPVVRCILHITPELHIHSTAPYPNFWRRMWYWILLGWTWENV